MTQARGMKFEIAPDEGDAEFDVVTIRQPAAKGAKERKHIYQGSSAQVAVLRFHLGAAAAICASFRQRELAQQLARIRDQLVAREMHNAAHAS